MTGKPARMQGAPFRKIIVFGHSGLIGRAVMKSLGGRQEPLELIGLSFADMDLADPSGADKIAVHLDRDTCVIILAAIKRQLGDSPEILLRNTAIVVNLASILAKHPVRRVVFLSSAAVYGEDVENRAITEDTPVQCRSYYGLGKFAAEWILGCHLGNVEGMSLGILRPASVYGPRESEPRYNPTAFLDAAVAGREIVLWGDGDELREMIFVDDVGRLVADYAFSAHTGVLNVVAGRSYSFRQMLDAVQRVVDRPLVVRTRPRSKAKVDNIFDNTRLRTYFPDVEFTPLEDGVRSTFEQRYGSARAPE